MHSFKDLKVWERAIELTALIYRSTKEFPKEEKFGLISQIRRSAVSVPSNIAEGAGRNTDGEFKQFLGIAKGSLYELETLLIISNKINLMSKNEYKELVSLIEEISKMISGLKKSLNKHE